MSTSLYRAAFATVFLFGCTSSVEPGDHPNGSGGKGDGLADVPAPIREAAQANLDRIQREIDANHLSSYGLSGTLPEQFLRALEIEYSAEPDQFHARVAALASMIFFAAPDVLPPDGGKTTP